MDYGARLTSLCAAARSQLPWIHVDLVRTAVRRVQRDGVPLESVIAASEREPHYWAQRILGILAEASDELSSKELVTLEELVREELHVEL